MAGFGINLLDLFVFCFRIKYCYGWSYYMLTS